MAYQYTVRSPSDPNGDKGGLGFDTLEAAEEHQAIMNAKLDEYDENDGSFWNKTFWTSKPEPWVIIEN